jgi:hypothetical protein
MTTNEETPQPFLPRVRMIWFFVIVTVVALALGIVQAADQGQAFAAAIVAMCGFLLLFGLLSAACFSFTYVFGFMEKSLDTSQTTASPFANGQLPEQVIPPSPTEIQ